MGGFKKVTRMVPNRGKKMGIAGIVGSGSTVGNQMARVGTNGWVKMLM
jgi:hypothetical protein